MPSGQSAPSYANERPQATEPYHATRVSSLLRSCGVALTAPTARGRPTPYRRILVLVVALAAGTVVAANAGLLETRGSVFLAGAAATVGLLRLIVEGEGDDRPGPFTRVVDAGAPPTRGATWLQDRERRLELATATSGDAYRLLRPAVADLVDEWLRATHGLDLAHAGAAHQLPPELWELVRLDGPRPENPHAAGPTRSEVAEIIGRLEALP